MDIPFESVAALIYRLGHPPKARGSSETPSPTSPSRIFASWLNHLPKTRPPHSGKQLFRLLFPHEGSRRRYGLKETKLAAELERLLAVHGLARWDSVSWDRGGQGGTGCLGREVELIMRDRVPQGTKSSLSIAALDAMLDELATPSPFSQLSQPITRSRSQITVLRILYRDSGLSPYACYVLTQILLRDVRPLLSPLPHLPIRNPTAMLRLKSTAGPAQLSLFEAMRCWHRNMAQLYIDGKGSLDLCADMAEALGQWRSVPAGPVVGVNVQIPKCRKGRSVEDALEVLSGSRTTPPAREVCAEAKYDGYRMQIHVEILSGQQPRFTIFSKSKRNSTLDRLNTHAIVLAALGLPADPGLPSHKALAKRLTESVPPVKRIKRSVILEAEVVPFNEGLREGSRGPGIEEFWWLGAAGVTAADGPSDGALGPFDANRNRHLCLVFFDILHLDGESLLQHTYDSRRKSLEEVISVIPGFSLIAEATRIPLTVNRQSALHALQSAFEKSNELRQEGLVLKAADSTYTEMLWQWVKLKKDYIPNLGDCIDLVVLGAGWDIDRARELRVDTSVFTSFYLGVLTNHDRVKSRTETPHFEILFCASYGMDRSQLEVYNENIRHGRWESKPYDKDDPFKKRLLGLSWTYRLPRGMRPPSVLFEQPLCAEVMGAGFQKLPESDFFEIRWPRLQKILDPRERPWTEALHARDLISTAHRSLGYLTSPVTSPVDDSIRAAWRSSFTVALTDIPDFPTPSPERPNPRRMHSAPGILKVSPPTPLSSATLVRRPLQTAARLQNAMLDQDGSVGGERGAWLRTPVASPRRMKRLGSPIVSPATRKRRQMETDHEAMTSPPGLSRPRTPISSPKQPSFSSLLPSDLPASSPPRISPSHARTSIWTNRPVHLQFPIGRIEKSRGSKMLARRSKPLSLRARIRLALRNIPPARVQVMA